MKFVSSIVTVMSVSSLISCNRIAPDNAKTKYLTEGNQKCFEVPSERIEQVRKMLPEGMLSKNYGSNFETALNRVAGIPDEYLNHLIERYKSKQLRGIYPQNYGSPGVKGETQLSGPQGSDIMLATYITTTQDAVGFALQHEIGHAMEGYVRKTKRVNGFKFDEGFRALYQEVTQHPQTRSYAKSDEAEAWAEAFANYYCSPESRNFIEENGSDKKRLAKTKEFLSKVLLPSVWETGTTPTPPEELKNQLFVRLEPQSDADRPSIQFAVPVATANVAVCENMNRSEECISSNASYQSLAADNKVSNGRKFISGYSMRANIFDSLQMIVIAKGTNGESLVTRVLQFSAIK